MAEITPAILDKLMKRLEEANSRYEELNRLMAQPEVAAEYSRLQGLAKEQAGLEELTRLFRGYRKLSQDLQDARALAAQEKDAEMAELAREEVAALEARREALVQEIRKALMPRDPRDAKDVIVEIRAGTGGDEAGLFAADLYRMYAAYAEAKRWQVEVIDSSPGELGGFKEIIFEVTGKGVFSRLKYERGVHRVQRVPLTEAAGRIHTSTATVVVLPEAEEVEVDIDPSDLRIDIYHSSGAGGQNVNKVSTAVRLVHLPTGMIVTCQDERSQLKNKQKAMAVLRARLLDNERRKQEEEITSERRSQVGSAERAEKVRTYNFPQGRVTDHRIGLTLYNIAAIIAGDLDPLVDALGAEDQAQQLEGALA
ncbi:MAG: peptide chain release factor 1 [Chloroflexi bacterium]|nr:peptide chain release factor 1 [Chloroflexota bacterium]